MTPDTYPCDATEACASCDADLVAAEHAEGRNPHVPFSLRPFKPLVKAVGPCVLDHEHDYMCSVICLRCDGAKGCPSNQCGRHHCAECGVGELKTDKCPALETR